MYCLELIKFDVSNTSYYVEVELLHDDAQSWKMILGGHGMPWKSHGKYLGKKCKSHRICIVLSFS